MLEVRALPPERTFTRLGPDSLPGVGEEEIRQDGGQLQRSVSLDAVAGALHPDHLGRG